MIKNFPLMETVPFKEFTSVTVTDSFNPMYDIEKTTEESLLKYSQKLLNKIFSLPYSKILHFIDYHCNFAKEPMEWLNNLEELVLANCLIFQDNGKAAHLIKIQSCIEIKRYKMNLENPLGINNYSRLDRKFINAESNERYFSFEEVQNKLNEIPIFEDKIALLTNQRFDYLQSAIIFVNQELPKFDKLCVSEIKRLKAIKKLEQELAKTVKGRSAPSILGNKIKINCNINQFVDIFFQLNRELEVEGKPFLDGKTGDFAKLINNNFVDKYGHEISQSTVETIFRPSRGDKRPKAHNRIDIEKLI